MATRIALTAGDIPAIEVEHVSPTLTMLRILDYKGEYLVQSLLDVNQVQELASALTSNGCEGVTDDD
jgi:muconolactone delta-isomerase